MNGLHKEQGKNLRNLITVYSQHFLKFSRNSVNGRHKEQGKNLRNSITVYSQHFLKFSLTFKLRIETKGYVKGFFIFR